MRKAVFVFSGFSLLLTACNFSLAGDVTPPPEAVISSNVTPMPVQAPVSAPDLAAGAEIYTNRCAPCHGATGLGDGEQAARLPFFPSAIGNPELARAASPQDWYRIISLGRIQRFMPPFEALTEQERWDVLAYVYSLGWDEDTLNRGAELYLLHQTEIDKLFKDYTPIETKLDFVETLGLPAEDAGALTAHLQAKALGINTQVNQVEQVTPSVGKVAPSAFGNFHGTIIYGSGDEIPSSLEVRLYGFDHTNQIVSEVTPVAVDGRFAFADIPLVAGRIFFVQVDYQGLSYFSEFVTIEDQANDFSLDVPIFETTADPSKLAVEKIQLIFDFTEPGSIRVVESVTISNLGDRAVAPDETGTPVLHFSLPALASNLSFEEGELGSRYIPDETGFGDTRAVIPGSNSYSMLFAYDLPYVSSLSYPITIDLPTRSIAVFLPEGQIEMGNGNFQLTGHQDINGTQYAVYVADQGYYIGDEIPLEISGKNPFGEGANSSTNGDRLLIGMAALTAAVGIAFFWLRRLPAEMPRQTQRILEQISLLDDQFEKGKIGKTSYNKHRKVLKGRLSAAVRKKERR